MNIWTFFKQFTNFSEVNLKLRENIEEEDLLYQCILCMIILSSNVAGDKLQKLLLGVTHVAPR